MRETLPYDTIACADALAFAAGLPASSVDLCLTSPPYWKKRDYGEPDQWGQETTPEEYVTRLVALFSEVRRALKPTGVLLLNLGDTYLNDPGGQNGAQGTISRRAMERNAEVGRQVRRHPTIRRKELVGIPWMVAFALRGDGWRIRAENVWAKPNPVPETVRDRTTRGHEQVFHLTKRANAYWDAASIEEPAAWERWGAQTLPKAQATGAAGSWLKERSKTEIDTTLKRDRKNRRSVWVFPVSTYGGGHKAVMPLALARLCVLAGCPPGGVVYDPFMGSGTTAVAASQLGRHYVGSEVSLVSVVEAAGRLAQEGGTEPLRSPAMPYVQMALTKGA